MRIGFPPLLPCPNRWPIHLKARGCKIFDASAPVTETETGIPLSQFLFYLKKEAVSNMTDYLRFQKANCKNCYKCIRHCPVKSIRFSANQAHIVSNECILCGQCVVVCPQNAKEIRSDLEKAKVLIAQEEPVVASIAPSFVANFPGITIQGMNKALQQLGFARAEETAIGATMVKKEYERLVAEKAQNVIISSCCHSVNLLIEKYYPEALPYLAHVLSPMQAHCQSIKQQPPGAKTIFIGPCVSKKAEADSYGDMVDCVLTFEELSQWLEEDGIALEPSNEREEQSRARLFPTSGGILRTMECTSPDYSYLHVDGVDNCVNALEDVIAGRLDNCFIEMSVCTNSCIGGPVMEKHRHSPVRKFLSVDRYAGKEDYPVQADFAMEKNFTYLGTEEPQPGEREIVEILRKMGKTKPEDELNCGSCGYDTCRKKAIAVYQGKADLTMCLPFLKEKAESFSDHIINNTPNGILVLNESLEVQQINLAALDILRLRRESDLLGEQVIRVLDPTPFMEVLRTGRAIRNQRAYLAEYQKYVEQTILYDASFRILICIMRDITPEESAREQREQMSRKTIETADKVVDKQMRIVQEIASLLGETAAETKIALTKLKESIRNDE